MSNRCIISDARLRYTTNHVCFTRTPLRSRSVRPCNWQRSLVAYLSAMQQLDILAAFPNTDDKAASPHPLPPPPPQSSASVLLTVGVAGVYYFYIFETKLVCTLLLRSTPNPFKCIHREAMYSTYNSVPRGSN